MKNKILILFILVFLGVTTIYAEDSIPIDKYDTKNIMLASIIYTRLGLILVYYIEDVAKESYIPFEFFRDGRAKTVIEDNYFISPQANIIYKNGKPFKVKIYVPAKTVGPTYKIMGAVAPEIEEKFKKTQDLEFEYK